MEFEWDERKATANLLPLETLQALQGDTATWWLLDSGGKRHGPGSARHVSSGPHAALVPPSKQRLGKPVLKASFVRTVGDRDRVYVVRSDGTEVSWAFPTYGDALPHDLIHLVVEAAFGLAQGFWGLVDAGADPAGIMADANRRGGRNRYSSFGTASSELQLAEGLANPGWLAGEPSTASLRERMIAACGESGLAAPALLSAERVDQVRVVLKHLATQWRGLNPKGAVHLTFDSRDAAGTFDRLSKEQAGQQLHEAE